MTFLNDIHKNIQQNKIVLENNNYFVTPYAYCFNDIVKYHKATDIIHYPFCVDYKHIIPLNKNPIKKLLLSGNINKYIYPSRHKLFQKYNKTKNDKDCIIDHLIHPGYKLGDKSEIINDDYILYLSKYLVCFASSSLKKDRPYFVRKYFEIPASGALLMANMKNVEDDAKQLGFKDMVNYIDVTDDNIYDKLKYVLNDKNRKEIDTIRKNGQELIKSRHMAIYRARYLDDKVNEIINNQ